MIMDSVFKKRVGENGAELLYIGELDDAFPVKTFFTTKNGGMSVGAVRIAQHGRCVG